jgi:16S rRNA (uracil1498-N3)-methyltransferase
MPATPAWPPRSLPRLFVERPINGLGPYELEGPPAHYLVNVLRLGAGNRVELFDDVSGQWTAEIAEAARKRVTLNILNHDGLRQAVPDLWLLFAPIKRGRIDWLVEKATELGVAKLLPVLTARTNAERVNLERLRAHSIEAAEQCGRNALPELASMEKLASLLRAWPEERTLYFADETGGEWFEAAGGPAAILIGPEGGFTPEERDMIRALPAAKPISLGPRILRAETAAVAALSLWMSQAGDW